ncbi:hypothetical protein [Fructobacillus durionis]|uniref:Type II secretory pathway, pseudopilin PulG n=1 Tax=Fructobacillus durionis TaxID=283737 RepID=A0A1I1DYB4_9LACO|nr:hypothetical protein [Fructobacillus durionis]SFB77988.1 hypothetical protein SAMN05660453_0114 [Fructobacillus durionis]
MLKNRERSAYVLLPTILILSALSMGYILQSRALTQRLQATKAIIRQEEVDTLQIRAATAYHQNGQKEGANKKASASYEVQPEKDRIQITVKGDVFERPLLHP